MMSCPAVGLGAVPPGTNAWCHDPPLQGCDPTRFFLVGLCKRFSLCFTPSSVNWGAEGQNICCNWNYQCRFSGQSPHLFKQETSPPCLDRGEAYWKWIKLLSLFLIKNNFFLSLVAIICLIIWFWTSCFCFKSSKLKLTFVLYFCISFHYIFNLVRSHINVDSELTNIFSELIFCT